MQEYPGPELDFMQVAPFRQGLDEQLGTIHDTRVNEMIIQFNFSIYFIFTFWKKSQ